MGIEERAELECEKERTGTCDCAERRDRRGGSCGRRRGEGGKEDSGGGVSGGVYTGGRCDEVFEEVGRGGEAGVS